jgi:membrane associated rhomboid family serine protease/Zn-finger nucleic acid-binding protein
MFLCPQCDRPLTRTTSPLGFVWQCGRCSGSAVPVPVLRRLVDAGTVQRLWGRAVLLPEPSERLCPSCEKSMRQVRFTAPAASFPLELCQRCHLAWFDDGELEEMPTGPSEAEPPAVLPADLLQQVAIREVTEKLSAERQSSAEQLDLGDVRRWPALLGLPVELHGATLRTVPYLTWGLAAIVTFVSIAAFYDMELLLRLALVPADPWRFGGATLLTTFVVHGGVWHLLGNLWFLLVFGDNVEEFLGRARWLLLVAGATVAGALLHVVGEPNSATPCVGASGGISGLVAFYALRFPQARLGLVLWIFWIPRWITFPAWGGFIAWGVLQGIVLLQQLSGFGNVSALAHLGGAAVGFLMWLATRGAGFGRLRSGNGGAAH